MHDLLIALAFIGMVVAPAVVAAKSGNADSKFGVIGIRSCSGSLSPLRPHTQRQSRFRLLMRRRHTIDLP